MRGPQENFASTLDEYLDDPPADQEDPALGVYHALVQEHFKGARDLTAQLAYVIWGARLWHDKPYPNNWAALLLAKEFVSGVSANDVAFFRRLLKAMEIVTGKRKLPRSGIEETLTVWRLFREQIGHNPTREELREVMGIKRMDRQLRRNFAAVDELFKYAGSPVAGSRSARKVPPERYVLGIA